MAAARTNPRTIEQLKSEYEDLNKRKIQAQTQLETAESSLAELQAEAQQQFGTSDIDKLTIKLQEMEDENERLRSDYQALLDKISRDLSEVESATTSTAANTSPTAKSSSSSDE